MEFIPHEDMNSISFSKTLNNVVLVLSYTLCEIGGYSCIKGTVLSARKDIHTWLFLHLSALLVVAKQVKIPGLRRNEKKSGAFTASAMILLFRIRR